MSLSVPPVTTSVTQTNTGRLGMDPRGSVPAPPSEELSAPTIIEVRYDVGRQELVFETGSGVSPVRNGDWVVITPTGTFLLAPSTGMLIFHRSRS